MDIRHGGRGAPFLTDWPLANLFVLLLDFINAGFVIGLMGQLGTFSFSSPQSDSHFAPCAGTDHEIRGRAVAAYWRATDRREQCLCMFSGVRLSKSVWQAFFVFVCARARYSRVDSMLPPSVSRFQSVCVCACMCVPSLSLCCCTLSCCGCCVYPTELLVACVCLCVAPCPVTWFFTEKLVCVLAQALLV